LRPQRSDEIGLDGRIIGARQADQLLGRIQRNIVRKRPLIDLWQGA
jgi:hypothetical protein